MRFQRRLTSSRTTMAPRASQSESRFLTAAAYPKGSPVTPAAHPASGASRAIYWRRGTMDQAHHPQSLDDDVQRGSWRAGKRSDLRVLLRREERLQGGHEGVSATSTAAKLSGCRSRLALAPGASPGTPGERRVGRRAHLLDADGLLQIHRLAGQGRCSERDHHLFGEDVQRGQEGERSYRCCRCCCDLSQRHTASDTMV